MHIIADLKIIGRCVIVASFPLHTAYIILYVFNDISILWFVLVI